MTREPDYAAEMKLPEGKTCGDCLSCRRCCLIFGHVPEDTSCDWWPSRFRPAPAATPILPGVSGAPGSIANLGEQPRTETHHA
jgi:hypothetical protein